MILLLNMITDPTILRSTSQTLHKEYKMHSDEKVYYMHTQQTPTWSI